MATESLPEHILKPHLRPIQPMQVAKDGRQFVALCDPARVCEQTMVVPPQVLGVLHYFRGERSLNEIADQLGAPLPQFVELAKGLDSVGLLWGPTFERLEEELKAKIAERGSFPAHAAATLGQDDAACRRQIEEYFDQTEDPEIEEDVLGIVSPHLDYQRGWPNYAAAYHPWRAAARSAGLTPDRVVILGTNHFGLGDGVVFTEYGFESPLGTCPADTVVAEKLVEALGRPLVIDQLDHAPEHSIQLQLPWLQYCFGNVPLVAALIPDPLVPMLDDDPQAESEEHASGRVTLNQFAETLRTILNEVGGHTLFVASSDLSHVGPQFGEPRPVDERRRIDVEQHDRDMMGKYLLGDPEEFLSAMRWNNNPTRWCSIGNMTALLMLAQPRQVELIDYRQAYDDNGHALVSSAAMALL